MTLTFELIRDIVTVNPSTKFRVRMSNGSAVRALTDGQTDGLTGPILYPRPLTREGIKTAKHCRQFLVQAHIHDSYARLVRSV